MMEIKKIVCCTDFSDSSMNAFNHALAIADRNKADLDLIHVQEHIVSPLTIPDHRGLSSEAILGNLDQIKRDMEKTYLKKANDSEVNLSIVVKKGHVSSEILKHLKNTDADLVIVGSRGISGMGLVNFGSVSRRIAQKSPCNVFVTRRKKTD